MKKPYIIALSMTAILVLWMASGFLNTKDKPMTSEILDQEVKLMSVQTDLQTAQNVQLNLTVQGQVEPNREVSIRTDIAGRIDEVLVNNGDWVDAGTVLVNLDIEDRQIKLNKERAQLEAKQKGYARAQELAKKNYQSKSMLEDTYALLKAAEASVAQIEFEIKKLKIRAPFAGVLEMRMVEQGAYVSANSEIAKFVDNSPLVVVVPVAQQNIQQVQLGAVSTVKFATGETREGKIRYVSPLANENTRTFRIEVEVDNQMREIPAGISAEVTIPIQNIAGHFVSPAILGLDAEGQMGVKSVDESNTVKFYPVTIIKADSDGIWIKGLPETTRIITVGQGYVEAGTKVDIVTESSQSTLSKKLISAQSDEAQRTSL